MSETKAADWLEDVQRAETRGIEHLGRRALALERLLVVSREIATLDLPTALERILHHVLELSGTRRGALLCVEPDGGLRPERVLGQGADELASAEFSFSRTLAAQALASGKVVVVEDVPASRHRERTSIVALGLEAAIAIPLQTRSETLGVLYLDTNRTAHAVSRPDASLLAAFGAQAAIALDNARLYRRLEDEVYRLERTLADSSRFDQILYRSAAMDRVCRAIRQVLQAPVTVLIQGQTGTGKDLVARAIHFNGPRKAGRFLAQNAGAMPDELLESELFGHRRGAFSGAVEHKVGLFEAAAGGTVFLDEIGEASPALQVRLLRTLETRTIRRLGETVDREVDVRVIAATHRDLAAEVAAGRFRADLYYRLSVFPIHVPPLAERLEDVELLAHHFLALANQSFGRQVRVIPQRTLVELVNRAWPGNVRELANLVQRLVLFSPGHELVAPSEVDEPAASPSLPAGEIAPLAAMEREHLRRALAAAQGNLSHAARLLGMKRGTLRWRLRKLGLEP